MNREEYLEFKNTLIKLRSAVKRLRGSDKYLPRLLLMDDCIAIQGDDTILDLDKVLEEMNND